MTEHDTDTPTDAELGSVCLVPDGCHATDDLTVAELSAVSRELRCDVVSALSDEGTGAGRSWDAYALLAWTWAKRSNPRAKLSPFKQLNGEQLLRCIGWDSEARAAAAGDQAGDQAGEDGADLEVDPTAPGRA